MTATADLAPYEAALAEDAEAWFRTLAPRAEPRPLLDWVATVRVPPDSPKAKGKAVPPTFDPREHHGQFEVLRVLQSRFYETPAGTRVHVREVTVLACVQDGKSLTLDMWVAHSVIEDSVHFVSAFPDRDRVTENWRDKLRPMIANSGYGDQLPTTGPGSNAGAKPESVQFLTGGQLYLRGAGASNEAGQASVTAERAKIDEMDSTRPRFVRLIANRTAAYGMRRLLCKTSTLKFDDPRHSATWQNWERGTRGMFHYRCPACQRWQPIEGVDSRDGTLRLMYDATDDVTARATAAIRCIDADCKHPITESERRAALRDYRLVMDGQQVDQATGVVIGEPPITEHWTIRWTATDSPLEKNLGDLAVEHRAAKGEIDDFGNHDRMRQLYRDEFVYFYTADQQQAVGLSPTSVVKLSMGSTYAIGSPPPQVRFMAAGADVQKYWIYWGVLGFDEQGSDYLLAMSVENLVRADGTPMQEGDEPDEADYWAALDRINLQIGSLFPSEDGRPQLVRRMLDLGFGLPKLRPWLSRHPEWTGVVGRGEMQVLRQQGATTGNRAVFIPGVADVRVEHDAWGDWHLWLLDSDHIKAQIHNGLQKARGKPGASYVPRGIEMRSRELGIKVDSPLAWVARHLCAEQRRVDPATGEVTWEKVDGGGRHDAFDVWTYARAGGLAHLEWLRAQQAQQQPASPARQQDRRAAPPINRRHSRIDRPR